jgi:hypothetical protein
MEGYTGKERREDADRDIKPGGKYHALAGKRFYSQYPYSPAETFVPKDVLETVKKSNGRLELRIRSVADDEDCFTECRIKAVERRKNKQTL